VITETPNKIDVEDPTTASLSPVRRGDGGGEGPSARGVENQEPLNRFGDPRSTDATRRPPLSPTLSPEYRGEAVIASLVLIVLPLIAFLARPYLAPWAFMWLFAFSIFLGCKWLTWWPLRRRAGLARNLAYLLAWPGMDAAAFLGPRVAARFDAKEWFATLAKMLAGAALLFIIPRRLYPAHPILAAWSAMPGIVLLIHFGFLHLIAIT
jgi:hypothetical protein